MMFAIALLVNYANYTMSEKLCVRPSDGDDDLDDDDEMMLVAAAAVRWLFQNPPQTVTSAWHRSARARVAHT